MILNIWVKLVRKGKQRRGIYVEVLGGFGLFLLPSKWAFSSFKYISRRKIGSIAWELRRVLSFQLPFVRALTSSSRALLRILSSDGKHQKFVEEIILIALYKIRVASSRARCCVNSHLSSNCALIRIHFS